MLILLLGISGSGKDFYVPYLEDEYSCITLSSDKFRKIITGTMEDQSKNGLVFTVFRAAVEHLLEDGHTVAVNATNYSKKNRKEFIDIGKKLKQEIRAVWIKTDKEICHRRNKERTRQVPDFVIEKQFAGFEEPTEEEGFDEIIIIDNNEDIKV